MLKGLRSQSTQDPSRRSAFRSSFFSQEGAAGAIILEGVVLDSNLANWTVDVLAKLDQRMFPGVQVSSPYLHHSRGEGFYVVPEIGAKCHICIPSEGSAPYLLDFIMPMEAVPDVEDDEENGGRPTYAGGRTRAKPGDMVLRGRDGNFCILHRGGVLQVGATPLAQRLYIPLQNLVTDISQNYEHHNTGGCERWYVNTAQSEKHPSTVHTQTFRLLANQENTSVRVSVGKLHDVVEERDSEIQSDMLQLGYDPKKSPIVCEVAFAPEAFTQTGETTDTTRPHTLLRYLFDYKGNFIGRTEGNVYVRGHRLRLRFKGDVEVFGRNLRLEVDGAARIQAGSLDIVSNTVRVNGGKNPVATKGSMVSLTMPPGMTFSVIIPPATAPVIATVVASPPISGVIASGVPTFLA